MNREFVRILRPLLVVMGMMCASCRYGLPDNAAAGAALLLSLTSTTNSFTWANQQLSLDLGTQGVYDTQFISEPMVLFDEGLYKMWYSASDGNNFRILYTESSDGVAWSNYQLAVDVGDSGTGYDSAFVYSPFVVKDGNTYKLWYSAQTGGNVRTLYAESSDGINWTNFSLALDLNSTGSSVDNQFAFSPAVLGNYRIWYTAVNSALSYQIASCTSGDGVNFSSCEVNLPPGTEGTYDTFRTGGPFVIQDSAGTYRVWYSAATANFDYDIVTCESADGINWTNCGLSIARNTQGTFDTVRVGGPSVLVVDGIARIWYYAASGEVTTRIMYAESLF